MDIYVLQQKNITGKDLIIFLCILFFDSAFHWRTLPTIKSIAMKRFITLVITCALCGVTCFAQDLIYRSFGSGSSRQSAPATQTIRSTAYYVYNGSYYKAPIQVELSSAYNHYGGTSYYVVAVWNSSGISGQWQRLVNKSPVYNCQGSYASGATAELEKSFMYKALVGTEWYYFDL